MYEAKYRLKKSNPLFTSIEHSIISAINRRKNIENQNREREYRTQKISGQQTLYNIIDQETENTSQ